MPPISQQSTMNCLLAERPGVAQLFTQLGIDLKRHERQTLKHLCGEYELDPHELLELLLEPNPISGEATRDNWTTASLCELMDYVVAFHHTYLRRQLRKLQLLAAKAHHDRGPNPERLAQVREILGEIQPELEERMQHEEQVLFPMIRQLEMARQGTSPLPERVAPPTEQIRHDYLEAARQMGRLRELTGDFAVPSDAPAAYGSLMEELSNLEADLERHNYLENEILLPRAIQLQTELMQ